MSLSVENLELPPHGKLLYLSLHRDSTLLAVGCTNGFQVYTCPEGAGTPTVLLTRVINPGGGIGIIEPVEKSNIFLLVGGGPVPCFRRNIVAIWDDAELQVVAQLPFDSDVRSVKIFRHDKVAVLLQERISIFALCHGSVEVSVPIGDNPRGVFCMPSADVVMYPAQTTGKLCVRYLDGDGTRTRYIPCHNAAVGFITASDDGSHIATVSENGTLVRIYDIGGSLIKEVRRGTKAAVVSSLVFSKDNRFLACMSTRGTVHIFNTTTPEASKGTAAGLKSYLGGWVPSAIKSYVEPERAFAYFTDNELVGLAGVCAFEPTVGPGSRYLLHLYTHSGLFWKLYFNGAQGGACQVANRCDLSIPTDRDRDRGI
jgi:hypothetical protein